MKKHVVCLLLCLALSVLCLPSLAEGTGEAKTLKLLFTHDMHSYFGVCTSNVGGHLREHGGAARLKTLLDENRDENTLYLDAGDFAMGTLLQAGYSSDAYELRLLGLLGCDATTFGNHEFDCGGTGAAQMLEAAMASGDPLPNFVQSNLNFEGELTDEQRALSDALSEYGARDYFLFEVNSLKVGVFGLMGLEAIEDAPTSGMKFVNYIDAAKNTVAKLQEEGADVIVCLSHAGTDGDRESGEDIELAKAVPDIGVIVSGHSHTTYDEVLMVGDTIIGSTGEYLSNLGSITLCVEEGKVTCTDYRLIPCDDTVAEDPEIAARYDEFKSRIEESYLADEGCSYDQVLCRSEIDFMPLSEMYAAHQEYPMGNLIADSYLYEARRNGIDDIDVAIVGLGTIRDTINQGDVTVSDAFEICSLGMGSDGSAGHPLLGAYVTGKELKLLVELDASLGTIVSSIKMSYSGLRYTFDTKRVLLDRAYDIRLVRPDGTEEEIENKKLYKVACNLYAANMLGMLNGLTKGILSITPKDADGKAIKDFYSCALKNAEGNEIKEWVAFKNYLASFPEKDGVPTVPASYAAPEGRKVKVSIGGLSMFKNPGIVTIVALYLPIALLLFIIYRICTHKKRKAKKKARKAAKRAAKAAKRAA